MRPIFFDINDISDSTIIYESKPHRSVVCIVYGVFVVLITGFLWTFLFKIDIVIEGGGILKGNDSVYEISSNIDGEIKTVRVADGQYVKKGQELYELEIDALKDTIEEYENRMEDIEERLEILTAYQKSLDTGKKSLTLLKDNRYFKEFADRRKLFFANIRKGIHSTNKEIELHQSNIDEILSNIDNCNLKVYNLKKMLECIKTKTNLFDVSKSYYYSRVENYLVNYKYTDQQYENKIIEQRREVEKLDTLMENPTPFFSTEEGEAACDSYKEQRKGILEEINAISDVKKQELQNLEWQERVAIEKEIEDLQETTKTININLVSEKKQLKSVQDTEDKNIQILEEKEQVSNEILSFEEKKKECKSQLEMYNIQRDNCTISAISSGYYYSQQELKKGCYIQTGENIGTIYPENNGEFHAEIYIRNSDIAEIREGQSVKFEIEALSSKQYGYITGTVQDISRDIVMDTNNINGYYVVKISCNMGNVKREERKEQILKNGMFCQAKIIIGKRRIISYLAEKWFL